MPSAKGKILVIRGGAIGDFILTLPVLRVLRERFPEVRLELLAYPRVTQLALASGLVDHAQPIDARPMASFFARHGDLPKELCEYFESFAVIVSYLFDPDEIFQENVARCSKAQFLVGPHRPDERGNMHASEAFLEPLKRLAIFDADPAPRLSLPPRAAQPGRPEFDLPPAAAGVGSQDPFAIDHWIAIHPGSGSERKNWAEQNWSALLRLLSTQTRWRFLLVGGEAEGGRLSRLASALNRDRVRIAHSLPLPHLGLLLEQCWAYLGHDSGISHLAAALGMQGVLLWGETRQATWRPQSPRMKLVVGQSGLDDLKLEQVLAAIETHFAGRGSSLTSG